METVKKSIRYLPEFIGILSAAAVLLLYTQKTCEGVRYGISLLGEIVIPSVFPFLVLSSYICESDATAVFCKYFKIPVKKLFNISENGVPAIIMGLIGGYPTGAKTVSALYGSGKITKNEAERLFYWCVNAGPAFTVSAVGSAMLKNPKAGIILYAATVLSSVTAGFFLRFFYDGKQITGNFSKSCEKSKQPIINAVYDASDAVIKISSWILLFSCFFGLLPKKDGNVFSSLFIKSVFEVTSGCRACAGTASLPVISAVIGFSGICVFCQVMPFLKNCEVKLINYICSRLFNASLSAFYTSVLLKLFPAVKNASSVMETPLGSFTVSYTAPVFAIFLTMCGVFIFELDNRKKI